MCKVELRDVNSNDPAQPIVAFGRTDVWINALDWHPSGRWLASAYSNGEIKIWDTEHNDIEITTSGESQNTPGDFVWSAKIHEISANAVAWSPDGTQIASSGNDSRIVIHKYNTTTFTHVNDFQRYEPLFIEKTFGPVLAVDWNPSGTLLASAGDEGIIYIWNTQSGETMSTLSGHQGAIHALDWSPDGNWIATAGRDKTVHLWDVSGLVPIQ